MATHPLRAPRPLLDRLCGFDQGSALMALALVCQWQDATGASVGLGLAGCAGLVRGLAVGLARRPVDLPVRPVETASHQASTAVQ